MFIVLWKYRSLYHLLQFSVATIIIRWDLQTGILGDSFQEGGTQFFKDSSAHYGHTMRNISSTE